MANKGPISAPFVVYFAQAFIEIVDAIRREAANAWSTATGRPIGYLPVSHEVFLGGATDARAPAEAIALFDYLFGTLLDGRNAYLTNGVTPALGRSARDSNDLLRPTRPRGGQ